MAARIVKRYHGNQRQQMKRAKVSLVRLLTAVDKRRRGRGGEDYLANSFGGQTFLDRATQMGLHLDILLAATTTLG